MNTGLPLFSRARSAFAFALALAFSVFSSASRDSSCSRSIRSAWVVVLISCWRKSESTDCTCGPSTSIRDAVLSPSSL
ncbi:hypothetical protein BDW74DRAFT_19741 [Aspergillus multicolor]|uniref:uncharacterized protein n=1 Tax=Aspergillus multicolor TaxID=41759 RepID=UPI003CCE2D64